MELKVLLVAPTLRVELQAGWTSPERVLQAASLAATATGAMQRAQSLRL
jgi:hypothetical protein